MVAILSSDCVHYIINSKYNSICYRVGNNLIDPGDEWVGFINIKSVLLTHAHFDHIYGLNKLISISPDALVYTNEIGRKMLLDAKRNMSYYCETPFTFQYPDKIRIVKDREIVNLSGENIAQAFYTPGHNPSCITWVIEDRVFSGDSLIPGLKTVTNLPDSDHWQSQKSEKIVLDIVNNVRHIYPGHALIKTDLK